MYSNFTILLILPSFFSLSLENLSIDIKKILFSGKYFISPILTLAKEQHAEIYCKSSGDLAIIFPLDNLVAGGGGAQTTGDGQDLYGYQTTLSVSFPDVEVHELVDPFFVLWRRYATNSGGAGYMRGGMGTLASWDWEMTRVIAWCRRGSPNWKGLSLLTEAVASQWR